jgi:hypothetical protein
MASTHINVVRLNQEDESSKVELTIRHQFPDIELISPVYADKNATCYLPPDQKVDVGSATQVGLNIDPTQVVSIGALMYKLQRKDIDQSNERESTCTQLVIIWKANIYHKFQAVSRLIEHDEDRIWDSDMLMDLARYCILYDIEHGPIEETWLMHDNTVLMTGMNATYEEKCYKLEMKISETSVKDDTERPQYINVDM